MKTRYRTLKKKIDAALQGGKKAEAEEHFQSYSSALDKAAKMNVIHKNSAARHKSTVSKLIASAS